jgi:NitT/TauT family transport system substrate-binding protein
VEEIQVKSALRRCIAAGLLVVAAAAVPLGAARGETDEIRIGLQYGFIYLPLSIADTEGFVAARARELGLPPVKVTLQRFSGSTAVNEALLSSSVDFGAYGLPGLLIAWEKTRGKLGIKGLLGLALTAYVLDANKSEIKSFGDFGPGDRIAVPASNSPQALLLRMAAEKFYGTGQYARVDSMMASLPHPDATAALLAGGSITGYFSTPPFSQILAKEPRIHPVLTSRAILGGHESSGAALGGSQRFVDANPKTTQALFLAVADAMKLIADDPRRAAGIYLKSEPQKLTNEEIEAQLGDGSTVFQAEPAGVMEYAEFMVKTGMLKARPDSWKDVFFPNVYEKGGS